MLKDFKEFAVKGNVVDMAVGIIIGGAFATIARSLVDDVLLPPIGLLLGNAEFSDLFWVLKEGTAPGPYDTVQAAEAAGAVTINYGLFINNVVTFVLVAFAVYLLVRGMVRLRRKEEAAPISPTERPCPFCATAISVKATRCPHCTSDLKAA